MKTILQITLSCLLSTGLLIAGAAQAQETSPLPTPDSQEITDNLKERLIETINSVTEVSAASLHIGYVGKVRDIIQNTIIVEDKSGKKNVLIDPDSQIVRSPGNSAIKLDSVKIDDSIIAIGSQIDKTDEIQGLRIIVSDTPFTPPPKTSGAAKITKISKTTLSLNSLGNSSPVTLDLTSRTILKNTQTTLDFTDLKIGDTVIYSALVSAKDPTDLTATVIMQINSSGVSPLPSSSPAAPASPLGRSAKPVISPKPSPEI